MFIQAASAKVGRLPHRTPIFDTARFVVAPLAPMTVRELLGELLQDRLLAEQLPWLQDKSADGALREAGLLELQCAAGAAKVWGIVDPVEGLFLGAVLATNTVGGVDMEVLCASPFWDQGIADEAGPPVADWLEDNMEFALVASH
jgi:hypothetical protein